MSPTKSTQLTKATEALDLISTGLLMLDQIDGLDGLVGPKAIDIAARLNANYSALSKHLDPLKKSIRVQALEDSPQADQVILRGDNYQATVRKILKTVLDTDRIKTFLGKKLAQFQTKREDTQVTFNVKG